MYYFSTNRTSVDVSFRKAVINGQPDDRGLYFPSEIPHIGAEWFARIGTISAAQVAFDVIRPYVGGEIADEKLFEICRETLEMDIPLVPLTERISSLELFHGPTLAFKDVGARFMSRCLGAFAADEGQKTLVIVATSGDTGGAVAAGFYGIEGVEVVILYPKGKVSRVQELQLTTFGGNVTTLELQGSFDDCQKIAKQILSDGEMRSKARLTSANSINVARWLPQQFYYFLAVKQWHGSEPPVISVPSGNFGNLAAGVLAHASGLPIKHFIAACNVNDVVPRFLIDGVYSPRTTIPTLSNAMDVGDPSNFVRISEIFGGDLERIRAAIKAYSVTDAETVDTIRNVYLQSNYILDPHGAVAYRSLANYLDGKLNEGGIFLETAHPVKFDAVANTLGNGGATPASVAELENKSRHSIEVPNDVDAVRDIILTRS